MRIYKYPVIVTDAFASEMPEGATVLCVAMQRDEPYMWAQVDETAPLTVRQFRLFGTGHPLSDEPLRYVGTFQLLGGNLVFHLFEAVS